MPKYGKTRGHHCWWLTIDGESAANFDNESDVDAIINLQSTLSKVGDFLENTAIPVFVLAKTDYPVSHGPKSNYQDLKNIIKLVETN